MTYYIYTFNQSLMQTTVNADENDAETYARYTAYTSNLMLWFILVRKWFGLFVDNPLYTATIYNAISKDHPNAHHQKDCKALHPTYQGLTDEDIKQAGYVLSTYYQLKKKYVDYYVDPYVQQMIDIRYKVNVIFGNIGSNIHYFSNAYLMIPWLTYFLGEEADLILNALLAGYSLPEYNYGYYCPEHKYQNIRRFNGSAVMLGLIYAVLVKGISDALGGGRLIKGMVASAVYQALIPIVMSKPLVSKEDGRDYFYYNRIITNTLIGVVASSLSPGVKKQTYALQLSFEKPKDELMRSGYLYLYLTDHCSENETKEDFVELSKNTAVEFAVKENNIIKKHPLFGNVLGDLHVESIKKTLQDGLVLIKKQEKTKQNFQKELAAIELTHADSARFYVVAEKMGYPKALSAKLQELNNNLIVSTFKTLFISSDLRSLDEFVRKESVKFYLDYNEQVFSMTIAIISFIRSSSAIKWGNSLTDWYVPADLAKIKKAIQFMLVDKANDVSEVLQQIIGERRNHVNELEADKVIKKIHEAKEAEDNPVEDKKVEIESDKPKPVVNLTLAADSEYRQKEFEEATAITVPDEDELFAPFENKKDLEDNWFDLSSPKEFGIFPSGVKQRQTVSLQPISQYR